VNVDNRKKHTVTDEDRLIELLQKHCDLTKTLQQLNASTVSIEIEQRAVLRRELTPTNDAIFELVDKYFRRELLPVLTHVFGSGVIGKQLPEQRRGDQSLRYTEWIQNFFVKMLDKRPDAFWKAQTAKNLRIWSSVVIANMMRDYLKRKKRGQKILADIAPLIAEKQKYFEDRYATTFEDFLNLLADGQASDDETLHQRAAVLRLRYVDGLTWQQIALDLAITDERLTKIRQQASTDLKMKLVR